MTKLVHTRIRLRGALPREDALRLAARLRRFPAVSGWRNSAAMP